MRFHFLSQPQEDFEGGMVVGEELVARLYNMEKEMWTDVPHGLGCVCLETYTWPATAVSNEQAGSAICSLRTEGEIGNYNYARVNIPVASLVLACDWMLCTSNNGEQSIRGSPVHEGSPLGVVYKNSSSVYAVGSTIDIDMGSPELYLRGKSKISMLVIGFYCTKKENASDSAIYHVIII